MEQKGKKIVLAWLLLVACVMESFAQQTEKKDSLIRLIKAQSVQIITKPDGSAWRKTVAPTFLHNDTYFVCDTAYWNVDRNIVNAIGNVSLTQNGTVLTSRKMDYFVDDNLAEFRGGVVQLIDKDKNTLRTRELDYYTADSLAVFSKGGALKDKDGQIIESRNGSYSSKSGVFNFNNNVNMFTDSVFIKTERLDYLSEENRAVFPTYIDFWKDDSMLSAAKGWYNRDEEIFFFNGNVHGLTKEQESWSDTLYFYRNTQDIWMKGVSQVQDSVRNTAALARSFYYCDSLSRITMRREAAVALKTETDGKVDTLYFGADVIEYYTVPKCDIPQGEIALAESRREEILTDPIGAYRKKAAIEAAQAAKDAAKDDINMQGRLKGKAGMKAAPESPDAKDSKQQPQESQPQAEESSAKEPQTEEPEQVVPDSTKVGFVMGVGNVKVFRKDIQVRADSVRYCELDSLARFYKDPIVWNDGNRQYTADSLFTLIRNQRADRASLMSNALVLTQEDEVCYDHIKGAEILAYFDSTAALTRFDALGGATTLFYLQEDDIISTVNKVECKMMSGVFKDGLLDKVYYFDSPKNDAYPLAQFPENERRMKGFNWNPDSQPKGPQDITSLKVRPSQRREYTARPKTEFKYTDAFFPGYMEGVYKGIEYRKTHPAKKPRSKKPADATPALQESIADSVSTPDSTAARADSISAQPGDSLSGVLASADTLASTAEADSLAAAAPTPAQIRRAEREKKRAERIAAREARWAQLDARDALKEEQKAQKALERKRKRTLKTLIAQDKEDAKDREKLAKYIEKYRKQKDRQNNAKRKSLK